MVERAQVPHRARARRPGPGNGGSRPGVAKRAARLEQLYNHLTIAQLAWSDMLAIANGYDVEPTPEHASRMLARKTLLANSARATVERAIEIAGGAAFFRAHALEWLWRDIQGAPFHPLPEKKQLAFSARVALGLPPIAPMAPMAPSTPG